MSFCQNAAAMIAIQAGQPTVVTGGTGACKTAMLEALARHLGLRPVVFIPSQHLPEDIGGFPHVDAKSRRTIIAHLDWLIELTKPGHMLIIDELTTAPQAMRPALLTVLNEGRIGDLTIHPDNLRAAAANPPELAPNASPLEPSMLNRLYHHEWQQPFESWLAGMMAGGKFEMPKNMPIVGEYTAYVPKWCQRVGYLLQRQPGLRSADAQFRQGGEPEEPGFCSLRQWHRLALVLAAADSVSAGADIFRELATGMIGSAGACQLMQSIAASDLYSAAEVVDGTSTIDYGTARLDQLVYLPCGVLETLEDDHAEQRIDRAVDVLLDMAGNGLVDCVGPVISRITTRFDYRLKADAMGRFGDLISRIGGAA